MKKIERNDYVVELEKDFLSKGEYNAIIKVALEGFISEDNNTIEGIRFNYLALEEIFLQSLGSICVKDFDGIMFEKMFENGMFDELLEIVINAKNALSTLNKIADKITSLENVIDINIQSLLKMIEEKIPDKKSLTKLVNKLPKEWQKVVEEHNDIIGKTDDTKEE